MAGFALTADQSQEVTSSCSVVPFSDDPLPIQNLTIVRVYMHTVFLVCSCSWEKKKKLIWLYNDAVAVLGCAAHPGNI